MNAESEQVYTISLPTEQDRDKWMKETQSIVLSTVNNNTNINSNSANSSASNTPKEIPNKLRRSTASTPSTSTPADQVNNRLVQTMRNLESKKSRSLERKNAITWDQVVIGNNHNNSNNNNISTTTNSSQSPPSIQKDDNNSPTLMSKERNRSNSLTNLRKDISLSTSSNGSTLSNSSNDGKFLSELRKKFKDGSSSGEENNNNNVNNNNNRSSTES